MQFCKLFWGFLFGVIALAYCEKPEEIISSVLKSNIRTLSQQEIIQQMELHFMKLKLLVALEPRKWAHPIFTKYEKGLIYDTDKDSLLTLIDHIVENSSKNPYLHEFPVTFKGQGLKTLLQNIEKDGHRGFLHHLLRHHFSFHQGKVKPVLTHSSRAQELIYKTKQVPSKPVSRKMLSAAMS